MMVLNLLLKRRGVLRHAYKFSGQASDFYRLSEVEYLIKCIKREQDRGDDSVGLGEGGDGYPRGLGDPGTVDNG